MAVVVAAGRGARMGAPINKVFLPLAGKPVLGHVLEALEQSPQVEGIVLVASPGEFATCQEISRQCKKLNAIVSGGETRQDSVYQGLMALPEDTGVVLVQDGARPNLTGELIEACMRSAKAFGSGVVSCPVNDTIKRVQGGLAVETLPRGSLRAVQTPQAFRYAQLLDAYRMARARGWQMTDDASVMERCGYPVHLVEGGRENVKITTPEDMLLAQALMGGGPRTGLGYDVHRLAEGRPLVLCGITVPYDKGLDGHSDADVALHALMDALLGAACLGDIGQHFPDKDPATEGISSLELLERVKAMLGSWRIAHVDVTIIAQRPKLAPFRQAMLDRLRAALPGTAVNLKFTTTERLGFAGRGEGIAAQAVATLC